MKCNTESGKTVVIVLVALVVVAVGALAYLSTSLPGAKEKPAEQGTQTANASEAPAAAADAPEILPGNPVVAKVDGQDIARLEVFQFIQTLPANQRLPIDQLFPLAVDQVVNAKIVDLKAKGADLDNDPQVVEQLENTKQQIIRTVFLQKQVEEQLTEDRIKAAYEEYKAAFKPVDQTRARHILVDDEALAKDIIAKLDADEAFEDLAKEHSKDGTAENGGDLGFFAKSDVVPEFAEKAFSLDPGKYTKAPVKSQFGFHVIKVEERRTTEPETYETASPLLQPQLRVKILNEIVEEWRKGATVERFDINGNAVEPAGGE